MGATPGSDQVAVSALLLDQPWQHRSMSSSWVCPDCARQFANRSQWHSCGNRELDDVPAGSTEDFMAIYLAVGATLADHGEFRVHPQKTRIAFISRMTFASVKLARRWADLSFILPYPVDHARIRRIDLYGPTSFAHEIRLDSAADVDASVGRWLAEALRRGDQETLDAGAHVDPVVGRPLELLRVPLAARVVETTDGGLSLRVPRYAAEAFDAHPLVFVRVAGAHHIAQIEATDAGGVLSFDSDVLRQLGLAPGDHIDAVLSADI